MCGICGVYSLAPSPQTQLAFKYLLAINSVRGMDSTGVVRVGHKEGASGYEVRHYKNTDDPISFLERQDVHDFLDKPSLPIIQLGHARAATKGTVSVKNAHPFAFSNVIGVHNGTIRIDFKDSDKFDTDSEAIYNLINTVGITETLKEIRSWTGAYTLVWIDKKAATLNFLRNSDRPLSLCYINNRQGLMWSSQQDHLEAVVKEMKIQHDGFEKGTTFFTPKPHYLIELPIGLPAEGLEFKKIDVDEHPPYTTWKSTQTNASYLDGMNPLGDDYSDVDDYLSGNIVFDDEGNEWKKRPDGSYIRTIVEKKGNVTTTKYVTTYEDPQKGGAAVAASISFKKPDPIVPRLTPPVFDESRPTSLRELNYKLDMGCSCCGGVAADAVTADDVIWYDRSHYICMECMMKPMMDAIIAEDPFHE